MRKSKTIIFFDRNGNVAKIKSSAGATRNNRAAFYLHRNAAEPTFGMKACRFIKSAMKNIRKFFRCAYAVVKLQAAEIERNQERQRSEGEAVICPALPSRSYEDVSA